MKLDKILDNINSLEKNSFLKIIDNIKSDNPKNCKQIDEILSESNVNLKSVDSINISKVFELTKDEFAETIRNEFVNTTSQLDILVDIIIKDGNNIIKQNWLSKLYENELLNIKKRAQDLNNKLNSENSEISDARKRDYRIYKACVEKAYTNDYDNNREARITDDELSIIVTLIEQLELSQEEVKLINYTIIPPKKMDIDNVITLLKNIGVIFYSKKNSLVYVADEVVRILRNIRKKEIANKHYRRVLKTLKESQLNAICKKHNINCKNINSESKIRLIIKEGISFTILMQFEIHKDKATLTEKKKTINELWSNGLKIPNTLKGVTLEEKIKNIIFFFNELEKDEKVGISIEGYEKLLIELNDEIKSFKGIVLNEFEMQEETLLNCNTLLDFNIKPHDILDIIPLEELKSFAQTKKIKLRGDLILNILDVYKDAENLMLENYEAIGFRNLSLLKENGIIIKESELGLKFEDLTQTIFKQLGFNVDEKLKKDINTSKNKIDILLNLGDNNIIIIECKTVKESGYNKFSSVSRQIKSYVDLTKNNGFNVVKSLIIAPDFSDDFVNECDLEFEINLSLISASSLINILKGFRETKLKQFPYQLLMKDVLIKEDRILRAIQK